LLWWGGSSVGSLKKTANLSHSPLVKTLRLALSEGPKKLCVSLPSPEDRNRISFQNIVFSSYLEFWMMEKVQNPCDFESEPFRLYLYLSCLMRLFFFLLLEKFVIYIINIWDMSLHSTVLIYVFKKPIVGRGRCLLPTILLAPMTINYFTDKYFYYHQIYNKQFTPRRLPQQIITAKIISLPETSAVWPLLVSRPVVHVIM
jgi:hypothetical protein